MARLSYYRLGALQNGTEARSNLWSQTEGILSFIWVIRGGGSVFFHYLLSRSNGNQKGGIHYIPMITRCGFQIVWGGSRLGALENGTEPRYDLRSPTAGIIGVQDGNS